MLKKYIYVILALSIYSAAQHASAAQEPDVTIGLIGDSTVTDEGGWGVGFAERLNDRGNVINYAKSGGTLAWLSKRLDELIAKKPDYILIQFGHNDMKFYDTRKYSNKLTNYIERIHKAEIKVIVLSSVTRRHFDESGKIKPPVVKGRTLPEYAKAAQTVAEKQGVPFIDLNTISIAHHNEIGPEVSATYNLKEEDKTHLNKIGAKAIADLIIPEFIAVAPEIAYIVRKDKEETE